MGSRRPTARKLIGFSDEELDSYRRACCDRTTRAIISVEDPDNVTEELKERFRDLCQLAAEKDSGLTNPAGSTPSEAPQPIQVFVRDSPYAEVDPPWQSSLLDAISPANYDPQGRSPLFSKLIPEIRSHIFAYVLAEYEDWDNEYKEEGEQDALTFCRFYRPGWRAPWKRDLNLLYTCRRVFHEAWHMPMQLATHRWCFDTTGPRETHDGVHKYNKVGRVAFDSLTKSNLDNLTSIHILCSRMWLQDLRKTSLSTWEMFRGPDPFPNLETITITIGWSQWQPYEVGEFDYDVFEIDDWPEVRTRLRLEFEAATCSNDEMQWVDELVNDLRGGKLEFETINGTPLVPDVSKEKPLKRRWLLDLPEEVDGDDYNLGTMGVGSDHPNPLELEVTVVDFVPGRQPRLRKDLDL